MTPATERRDFSWGLGILLASAFTLNIMALSMTEWVYEDARIPTTYPAVLLNESKSYTPSDLRPGNTSSYAFFRGMRAGTFRICFTLADESKLFLPVDKEVCASYRQAVEYRAVVSYGGDRPYVNVASHSMCGLTAYSYAGEIASQIGISSYLMLPFLDKFCGFQGYLAAVLQIGAVISIFVAVNAWLSSVCQTHKTQKPHTIMTLASCVAATLALATYVLWLGAFTASADVWSSSGMVYGRMANTDGIVQGASAYCTIASVGVLVVAALMLHCSRQRTEPLVDEQRVDEPPFQLA
jgi:predicted outer membrane lipoprotein